MLGNGTITSEMREAGEMFRKQFRFAALDTLRAMPLIGGGPIALAVDRDAHGADLSADGPPAPLFR